MNSADIAICGAGPVGLAAALLLVRHGVAPGRIALLDAKNAEQAAADPRSIAISYGSRQILEQLGAWPLAAADEIHQIHVSRRGHFGRTLIEREEMGVPALGYVTRYGALTAALGASAERAGITVLRPRKVEHMDETDDAVSLTGAGETLHAQIAIQAEGGLFGEQENKGLRRDYEQSAIVAQVWSNAPVGQRAFERFTEEGPLALLPQDGGYALVWCVRPARAEALLALSDAEFLKALGDAFGTRVGGFTRTTPRHAFVLGLNARAAASKRTVAIGNASQTLHPVAGQGLNLGLRDAVVLAQCLRKGIAPESLASFVQRRDADRKVTIRLTDTMARIFTSAPDGSLTQGLLGASLGAIDLLKPAKEILAEQMMFGWR
ncbi:MAG TPA: FAD-dependent monooxygenase [Burkholderiaceae bacterium]